MSSKRQIRPPSKSFLETTPLKYFSVLVVLERRPVGPLGVDLDGPEEAHPPDLLDDRMVGRHAPELVAEMPFEVVDVLEQVLALDDPDVLERDRAETGMAAEGRTVGEHRRVALSVEDILSLTTTPPMGR